MFRKFIALAAAAFVTQAASADVLYTWQQLDHSPSMPDGLHLELLFSDAAVAQGSLDLNLVNLCASQGYCVQQQDSLLALRYWYAGADGAQQWNRIDYRLGDETQFGYQQFSMTLNFLPNGKLSGKISANDSNSDFAMQSDGDIFTMLWANSDEPDGCGFAYPECSGERGRLLNKTPPEHPDGAPVPEPDGLATLAIGAAAALAARRRRTRKQ